MTLFVLVMHLKKVVAKRVQERSQANKVLKGCFENCNVKKGSQVRSEI